MPQGIFCSSMLQAYSVLKSYTHLKVTAWRLAGLPSLVSFLSPWVPSTGLWHPDDPCLCNCLIVFPISCQLCEDTEHACLLHSQPSSVPDTQ